MGQPISLLYLSPFRFTLYSLYGWVPRVWNPLSWLCHAWRVYITISPYSTVSMHSSMLAFPGGYSTLILVKGMQPKGPSRGACERTTAKLGTLVDWISEQNVALWSEFWPIWGFQRELSPNFKALELKISRNLWFEGKNRILRTGKQWNGSLVNIQEGMERGPSGPLIPVHHFSVTAPPPHLHTLHRKYNQGEITFFLLASDQMEFDLTIKQGKAVSF